MYSSVKKQFILKNYFITNILNDLQYKYICKKLLRR